MNFDCSDLHAKFEAFHGISWDDTRLLPVSSGAKLHLQNAYKHDFEIWKAAHDSRDTEIEALRKNAERYRWLALSGNVELYVHNLPGVDNCKQIGGDGLNEAIDKMLLLEQASAPVECKHPKIQRGHKDGYYLGWCATCGLIQWCSDGGIPDWLREKDSHENWCAKNLSAWSCAHEANGHSCCKSWCGQNYCAAAYKTAKAHNNDSN